MPKTIDIRFIDKDDLPGIIPLLRLLNPDIPDAELGARLEQMKLHNYQCVGAFDGNSLIGISGIWILHKIYTGKHIELDNVCILPEFRGKGIGENLVSWILDYAKDQGCRSAELNCYLGIKKGQEFWQNQGFEAVGYHYIQKMN